MDVAKLLDSYHESQNKMPKCLIWLLHSIFILNFYEAYVHAVLALSVFCYTEFSIDICVIGGSFSFLRIELGDFVVFVATGNILLKVIVGFVGLGWSWTSYFSTMIRNDFDSLRIRAPFFLKSK